MKDDKTIRRGKHSHNYIVIGNALAQNRELSFESRGLLIELLSRPENWQASISSLIIPGKAGRDKVRRIITELIAHGYISERERKQRQDGTYYYTPYVVNEQPLTGKPLTVEPFTENPQLQSTDKESTEKQKLPIGADAPAQTFDFESYKSAIVSVFGVNGGRSMNLLHLMRGTSKKKGYTDYNITPPASIDELRGFKSWYQKQYNATMPLSPEKIQSHFIAYREYEQKRQSAASMRIEQATAQAVPVEITDEQRQANIAALKEAQELMRKDKGA